MAMRAMPRIGGAVQLERARGGARSPPQPDDSAERGVGAIPLGLRRGRRRTEVHPARMLEQGFVVRLDRALDRRRPRNTTRRIPIAEGDRDQTQQQDERAGAEGTPRR
jgi:hypothetical protein